MNRSNLGDRLWPVLFCCQVHCFVRRLLLTDEEQDVQRDISNTVVDTAAIVERIGQKIYADIYQTRKFRYENKYDFDFDKMVDGVAVGNVTDGMKLRFLTVATDAYEKSRAPSADGIPWPGHCGTLGVVLL